MHLPPSLQNTACFSFPKFCHCSSQKISLHAKTAAGLNHVKVESAYIVHSLSYLRRRKKTDRCAFCEDFCTKSFMCILNRNYVPKQVSDHSFTRPEREPTTSRKTYDCLLQDHDADPQPLQRCLIIHLQDRNADPQPRGKIWTPKR